MALSILKSNIEQNTVTTEAQLDYDVLLERSLSVTKEDDYSTASRKIFSNIDADREVKMKHINVETTLANVAKQYYHHQKYWRLILTTNQEMLGLDPQTASPSLIVPKGVVIRIFIPKRSLEEITIIRVTSQDIRTAYDEILQWIDDGVIYGEDQTALLMKYYFEERKVYGLTETIADTTSGATSLREFSLKYHGDSRYWPIIKWTNAAVIPEDATEHTKIKSNTEVLILHFINPTQ